VPKRKIKETKPMRRLGKKELLIAPVAMGAATLVALVIIPAIAPPPDPTGVCLKAHNIETFQLYPQVQVIVDGQQVMLPDGVGKEPNSKGEECLRPIHTDAIGNVVHIEYIRPIQFNMGHFMKIYSFDNRTISVVDSSSGANLTRTLNLTNYDVEYSYFTGVGPEEKWEIRKPSEFPSFPADNKMLAKIELTSK
jgi:hypothetical protein